MVKISLITSVVQKGKLKINFRICSLDDIRLVPDTYYEYSFSYTISRAAPSSIISKYSFIRYKMCVVFDMSWEPDIDAYKTPFRVIQPVNLNDYPNLKVHSFGDAIEKNKKPYFINTFSASDDGCKTPVFISILFALLQYGTIAYFSWYKGWWLYATSDNQFKPRNW